MVDAGVTVVLSKLQEVASAEVTALLKVDDQIRVLRRGLCYLQAEVRGADRQRRGRASELLLLWARETREVVFDVEDAVDEFHLKVEAFQVKAKSGRTWYHSAVNLLNGLAMQLFVRHGLSRDITKIQERIKEIGQIKETYRIDSSPSELWSQSSIGVVWDIEGGSIDLRKREFKALKNQILYTDGSCIHRPVISILGASGTGKTRLARKLYNDRKIRENFEVVSWICLPPHVRFEQYVDMILEQIRPQVVKDSHGHGYGGIRSGDTNTTTDAASSSSPQMTTSSEELKELLEGRSYLVVLDGLVDTGNWNSLLALLPGDNLKSRILVTTQLSAKEMKQQAGPDPKMKPPTVLNPLDRFQTADLFRERVHGAAADSFSRRVHGISRGLPLAVIVLGGVLRTKAYPSEWKDVFSQKLETPMGEAKAMRFLWLLAFEELPNHLKSCFLYLATASENMLLDAARMVRLWIAEGFIAPSKGKTLEEVGLGYLRELVSRGLVELAERDARGAGITKVTVHSLLHAFVQAEAQESGFLEIHHHASVLNPHAVRRLAIHNFVDSFVDIPDRFPKLRSLLCDFLEEEQDNSDSRRRRTVVQLHHQPHSQRWACPWGVNPAEWLLRACGGGGTFDTPDAAAGKKLHQLSIIRGSRFLRVIDLYGLLIERVPDEIGSSVHLRYLGIRNCKLRQLPASISKLDNLQTLDVRKTRVESVANEFWDLHGLRHVLASSLLLSKCPNVHLKNLQTLDGVVPTADAWSSTAGCCPLNHMVNLRSLRVCSIPESPDVVSALLSALEKMEFLVMLSLSGSLLPSGVFNNPSSRRLEALALHGRLDSPPSDPFMLPNLGKLTLSRSGSGNLTQDFIDKVAGLPNLAEMELLDGSYGPQELIFHEGGFPSLIKLKLNNLMGLEKLELVHGSAPELAILTSSGCTKMKLYNNRQTPSFEGENNEGDMSDIEDSTEPGFMPRPRGFDREDLGSTMMVRSRGMEDFELRRKDVGESEEDLESTMILRESEEDLGSTMMVRRVMEDFELRRKVVRESEEDLESTMILRESEEDLGSTMMVRRGKEDFELRMVVRESEEDIESTMMVRMGKEDLESTMMVRESEEDLGSTMMVRVGKEDLESRMIVREGEEDLGSKMDDKSIAMMKPELEAKRGTLHEISYSKDS